MMRRLVFFMIMVLGLCSAATVRAQGVAVFFYYPDEPAASEPAALKTTSAKDSLALGAPAAAMHAAGGATATNIVADANAAPAPAKSISELEAAYIIDNHPRGRFRWGADVGGTIDLTGQDASSYDISISFGFSRKWINFLGFGAKAAFSVSNSNRAFPLFLNFRTNFKNRPSIVFWDLKGGLALNYPGDNRSHAGAYASTGVGFYLARSATFSSHVLLAYTFRQQDASWTPDGAPALKDLHMATLKIGVMF
ncbi:MAG: hypothetical protein K2M06_03325 [Muribaculaceae bacterium]|nr:hypothetical protein [Muribaculaceae bacterium]